MSMNGPAGDGRGGDAEAQAVALVRRIGLGGIVHDVARPSRTTSGAQKSWVVAAQPGFAGSASPRCCQCTRSLDRATWMLIHLPSRWVCVA